METKIAAQFNKETWQDFDYESLNNVQDCIVIKRELEKIVENIENQIRVAEIQINKGEGNQVDSMWYRAALSALSIAKGKLKWVSSLRNNLEKEASYAAKIEEKNRTEQIIILLEKISGSLCVIAERALKK